MSQLLAREALKEGKRKDWEVVAYPEKAAKYAARKAKKKMSQLLAREALKEGKCKDWEAAYPEKAAKYAARKAKKREKAKQQALAIEAPKTAEPAKTPVCPRNRFRGRNRVTR